MKTACDLISAAAELTSCVEDSINYRCGGDALFRVDTGRDSSSVIGNFDNIAGENFYIDLGAVACERFIDSVIDYFIYKMMKSLRTGRTDVHTRSYSYRFKSFQDLNLIFIIFIVYCGFLIFSHYLTTFH